MTDMYFPVLWRPMWRKLTIYLSLAIIVPLTAMMGFRIFKLGPSEAFRHVSVLGAAGLLLGTIVFAAIVALTVALISRCMSVRVANNMLVGRNYWGLRKKIPLSEITGLSFYSNSGFEAAVVSSSRHGKIYVLTQTVHFSELIELLETYLPEEEEA